MPAAKPAALGPLRLARPTSSMRLTATSRPERTLLCP